MYVFGILKLDTAVLRLRKQVNSILMKYLPGEVILYVNCVRKMLACPRREWILGHGIFFIVVQNKINNVKIGKFSSRDWAGTGLFRSTTI